VGPRALSFLDGNRFAALRCRLCRRELLDCSPPCPPQTVKVYPHEMAQTSSRLVLRKQGFAPPHNLTHRRAFVVSHNPVPHDQLTNHQSPSKLSLLTLPRLSTLPVCCSAPTDCAGIPHPFAEVVQARQGGRPVSALVWRIDRTDRGNVV